MKKKQKIIITVLELVVEQGVHATPMSQIAREAGVAVGTIYHYFNSKDEIIEEIYTMICKDFGVVMMANVPEKSVKKQFETMWLNLYNYFVSNPLAFRFMEFVGVPPIITQDIREQNIDNFINVRDFFLAAILSKDFRDVNLRLLLQLTFGNVISCVRLKYKNELEMTDEQINDAIEMSWDCVKNRKRY